jgi:hypothetical protein
MLFCSAFAASGRNIGDLEIHLLTRFPSADCFFDVQVWIAGLVFSLCLCASARAQNPSASIAHAFFIDCSASRAGDGSVERPWNSLATAQAHPFTAGDRIALARGTTCQGSFAPQGSGMEGSVIRLTAYGKGKRPRIVAAAGDRQALLLSNQEYWQIDSLDVSGGRMYGIFVTGDRGTLHHLYLKNLFVHDVYGGAMRNKDNGLVVVGPSEPASVFSDVLVDGVDVAHSNQWSGILVGGGNFNFPPHAPLNGHVTIRNSTAHDVYGDGIVLFRDEASAIEASAAWQTGMQPTQDIGTPNAIWTWTCTDCTVEDNEAYVTDSPGVDGGAYDIDWDNIRNTVERNFAHDTQGYCFAVFAAGYVTSESTVQDNLCVDNGLSPRLAALQGAVYLHTWNGGILRGLTIEHNTIEWNPRVPGAAAIVNDAVFDGPPAIFARNRIASTSPLVYRVTTPWTSSANAYALNGEPLFTVGSRQSIPLSALQSAGAESGSAKEQRAAVFPLSKALRIEATLDPALDEDGLLTPEARAQLVVLRSVAGQYGPARLAVTVHLPKASASQAEADALADLDDVYPGALRYARDAAAGPKSENIRLESAEGRLIEEWHGFQNAAALGGAVRARLGAPDYSHMQRESAGGRP